MDDETRIPETPTLLLDRYRIDGMLGEGGLGTVYKAYDTRLKRTVAIKTLKRSVYRDDPEMFRILEERFQREAEAGSRMHVHPNLVVVHDFVTDADKSLYLVQEFVPGGTLADRLASEGALPQSDALRLAGDVARGLAAAHEMHIVHRDIKPANILLSADGRARVGDFGIAQLDDLSGRTRATSGHPGTPLYMSPEQAGSSGYVRAESDQYSLGLVLFEMLTGQTYKRLRKRQADELLSKQPHQIQTVVRRMLVDDPDDRYESMTDIATDIARIERQLAAATTSPPSPPSPTRPDTIAQFTEPERDVAVDYEPALTQSGIQPQVRQTERETRRQTPRVNLQPNAAARLHPPPVVPFRKAINRRNTIAASAVLALIVGSVVVVGMMHSTGSPTATTTVVAAAPTIAPSLVATATSAVAAIPNVATPTSSLSPTTPLPTATAEQASTPESPVVSTSPAAGVASSTPPSGNQGNSTPSNSLDLSQAAAAALPTGTTLGTISSIDLAGDGQVEALVTGQETPISPTFVTNDVAVLVAWQSNRWNVIYRTKYESGGQYVANIDGYTKTATHPGFVLVTSGTHGAGSHSFVGFVVFRWEAGKLIKVMERPTVSKEIASANKETGAIMSEAPVYQGTAADCCPSYLVSSTWIWKNNELRLDKSYTFQTLAGSNTQMPSWLAKDGSQLFALLANLKDGGSSMSFKTSTIVRGLDGQTCSAPGGVLAIALGSYATISPGSLWESSGTYYASIGIISRDSSGKPLTAPVVQAGDCRLGGSNITGYLLHISPKGNGLEVDSIDALGDNSKLAVTGAEIHVISL